MSNHKNKTPRVRSADSGEYAKTYLAKLYPDKYVTEWDDRTGDKKKTRNS